MSTSEKISIIVPVYNVEKYLDRCINSILKQTYQNLEIILVDDGSTDNSVEICDEYAKKDNRIKVVHKANGGLSDARNVGIDNATGEYIGLIDSDDWISEDMYLILYNNIKKENADISCCNKFLVYTNMMIPYGNVDFYEVMNSERAIELMCTHGYLETSAYAKLYKKEIFQNIRYPKGKVNEDIYTTYKLLDKASKIVYDATPLYYYRQRKGSITNSKKVNVNAMEASKELLDFVDKKYPKIKNVAIKSYIFYSIGVYDNILVSKCKDRLELKVKIRKEVKQYYSIVKKDKALSKSRKVQLFLIRYFRILYDITFKLYDIVRNHIKKKE